jgi:hypothetical protein
VFTTKSGFALMTRFFPGKKPVNATPSRAAFLIHS